MRADSYLNWGFNPEMNKGGDYFLICATHLMGREWPYRMETYHHIFNKEDFLKIINIKNNIAREDAGARNDLINRLTPVNEGYFINRYLNWRLRHLIIDAPLVELSNWGGIDEFDNMISDIENIDWEEWVDNGEAGMNRGNYIQDLNAEYDADGFSTADLIVSSDYIGISIRATPAWEDQPPYLYNYFISRMVI